MFYHSFVYKTFKVCVFGTSFMFFFGIFQASFQQSSEQLVKCIDLLARRDAYFCAKITGRIVGSVDLGVALDALERTFESFSQKSFLAWNDFWIEFYDMVLVISSFPNRLERLAVDGSPLALHDFFCQSYSVYKSKLVRMRQIGKKMAKLALSLSRHRMDFPLTKEVDWLLLQRLDRKLALISEIAWTWNDLEQWANEDLAGPRGIAPEAFIALNIVGTREIYVGIAQHVVCFYNYLQNGPKHPYVGVFLQ